MKPVAMRQALCRRSLALEPTQNEFHDPPIRIDLMFSLGVEAHDHFEFDIPGADGDSIGLMQSVQPQKVEGLCSSESESCRRLSLLVLEGEDSHADQVRAMDALE